MGGGSAGRALTGTLSRLAPPQGLGIVKFQKRVLRAVVTYLVENSLFQILVDLAGKDQSLLILETDNHGLHLLDESIRESAHAGKISSIAAILASSAMGVDRYLRVIHLLGQPSRL